MTDDRLTAGGSCLTIVPFSSAMMLLLLVCLAGPPQATSTLTGRVVADDTGMPVANASIVLIAGEDEDVVLTDRDGRFTIQMPPTKRELRVHKAGFEQLRLQPRDDETSLDVRLHRAAVLSGRVIDPRGDHANHRSRHVVRLRHDEDLPSRRFRRE